MKPLLIIADGAEDALAAAQAIGLHPGHNHLWKAVSRLSQVQGLRDGSYVVTGPAGTTTMGLHLSDYLDQTGHTRITMDRARDLYVPNRRRIIYLHVDCGGSTLAAKITEGEPGQWGAGLPEPPVLDCPFCGKPHQMQGWSREQYEDFHDGNDVGVAVMDLPATARVDRIALIRRQGLI